ncbi:hypothetical protein LUZ63_014442 [Rhynchospora breviuscula]|uniref:Uncharacterized protein n=1 Tax=Rhynchospora breviuscula TaxID=2022672 RepID=A0A9Q0CAI1_9POAL|nr:hypothetical protein LUZ63_014442 [Rhynchospora breviuscula]
MPSDEIHECSIHQRRRRPTGSNNNNQSGGGSAVGDSDGSWTSIHLNALDAIVSHNSLFTGAVFTGLSISPSSGSTNFCAASRQVQQDVVSFSAYALSAFLFSSLVALALKQAIRMGKPYSTHAVRIDRVMLRAGLMATAIGSIVGIGFLMLGLVNLVQVKLGRLGCGAAAAATAGAVVPLVTLVPAAMLIYSVVILHAFSH